MADIATRAHHVANAIIHRRGTAVTQPSVGLELLPMSLTFVLVSHCSVTLAKCFGQPRCSSSVSDSATVNTVAVARLPPERSGTASGLVNTARMVGATLGISVHGSPFAVHAGDGSPEIMLAGRRLAYLVLAADCRADRAALAFAFRADSIILTDCFCYLFSFSICKNTLYSCDSDAPRACPDAGVAQCPCPFMSLASGARRPKVA